MNGVWCEADTAVCTGRAAHIHHRKPRSHGRDDSPENTLIVCAACHTFIHAHPAISYEKGWLVHSWDTVAGSET